eukprot:SAG22_NODE_4738_length_1178_cov_2.215941_1_plen_158_part_01
MCSAEVGVNVQSGGAGFQAKCPAVATNRNPCAAAMINYEKGKDKSRFSWDPLSESSCAARPPACPPARPRDRLSTDSHDLRGVYNDRNKHLALSLSFSAATLVAVRGAAAGSTHECTDCGAGRNVIDPATGSNKWVASPTTTNQTYLVLVSRGGHFLV